MNVLKHRGIWFFYPNYLESPRGPWGRYETYGDQPLLLWKRAIDWMAENGITFMIAGIPPYKKDLVMHDWGYHYVLDFDRYPEARVFSHDFVRSNRAKLAEIFAHAKNRGIDAYIHHYNFIAPESFVKAHSELRQKLQWNKSYQPEIYPHSYADWLGTLSMYLCWHEPVYRDFMISCWKEFLQHFPEITGILVTPGEYTYCSCDYCREHRPEVVADFIHIFVAVMKEHGKNPLVRGWWGHKHKSLLPQDVTYVLKYSVFDCIGGVGPDPLVKQWLDAGHQVWISKEITGSENGGPMVWVNPEYFHEVAERVRSLKKVEGVVATLSSDLGAYALNSWTQSINLLSYAFYANHQKPYDDKRWKSLFGDFFGSAGGEIYRAAELISEWVLGISKVIYQATEGYTWGYFYTFKEEKVGWTTPGSIQAHTNVPEWVRGEMATFREYLDYLEKNPWSDEVLERVNQGRKGPLEFLKEITQKAKEGWEILEVHQGKVSGKKQEELRILLQSAKLAYYTGLEWQHRLRARLNYAGVHSTDDSGTRQRLTKECLDELGKACGALREQLGIMLDFPEGFMDFRSRLGLHRESFFPDSASQRLKRMTKEMEEIRREFAGLQPRK